MFAFDGPSNCVPSNCPGLPSQPLSGGLDFDNWWCTFTVYIMRLGGGLILRVGLQFVGQTILDRSKSKGFSDSRAQS